MNEPVYRLHSIHKNWLVVTHFITFYLDLITSLVYVARNKTKENKTKDELECVLRCHSQKKKRERKK